MYWGRRSLDLKDTKWKECTWIEEGFGWKAD
jgi:hypothetical protein